MEYVEVLKKLVSIDTSVPPGNNYAQAVDYLETFFIGMGFTTHKIAIPPEHAEGRPGRVNLVSHRRRQGLQRLIFYGHLDVVPAEGWDAFNLREENGKLYGRGTADMKGSIVALIAAMQRLKNRNLNFDISVILTTDEELSQASQLKYLAGYLHPVAGAYFCNLDSSAGFVSVTGLGALQMEIRVKGRSVHSGLSHLGENAVEKAFFLLQALLGLKNKLETKKSSVPVHHATGLTHMQPRLNINMISGGLKVNIVPDECVISIDRRLIPEENLADAQAELIEVLKSVPGVNWEISAVTTIPAVPPRDDPVIDRLSAIVTRVTGEGGKFGEMGSGDLSSIVAGWGALGFGMGVIRPECNIHGKNEFVYLKDIQNLAEVIELFVTS
ncbi:MAG: M20/M25/M40 family metallo-hydrolase [Dehalococcoidaceae bacterium]|nr:M20/M25/M40 family metallo-hydrolase [Dehalococcoidaceae bacterium]